MFSPAARLGQTGLSSLNNVRGGFAPQSVLDALAALVEVLQEVALVLELDIVVVRKAFVPNYGSLANASDQVELLGAPDITILHIV